MVDVAVEVLKVDTLDSVAALQMVAPTPIVPKVPLKLKPVPPIP